MQYRQVRGEARAGANWHSSQLERGCPAARLSCLRPLFKPLVLPQPAQVAIRKRQAGSATEHSQLHTNVIAAGNVANEKFPSRIIEAAKVVLALANSCAEITLISVIIQSACVAAASVTVQRQWLVTCPSLSQPACNSSSFRAIGNQLCLMPCPNRSCSCCISLADQINVLEPAAQVKQLRDSRIDSKKFKAPTPVSRTASSRRT